jgi:hypothetical protein
MSILAYIKKDQLQARKNRNSVATSLLTTLIGALDTKSAGTNADLSDAEVIAEIKKFLKNAQETRGHLEASDVDVSLQLEEINREIEILMGYLPVQLNEGALKIAIDRILQDLGEKSNVGTVMKLLKAKYDGQYDGALASKLVKEALQFNYNNTWV